MKTLLLPLAKLAPDPDNPRSSVAVDVDLNALVASIRTRGLLLPLRVRPATTDGTHTVVSGHRRLAALRTLGVTDAPCVIADGPMTDAEVLAEQLAENLHRENLDPLDEAAGFHRYITLRNITAVQAAAELHASPARISRALPLLDLPDEVKTAVRKGTIAKETAYHLARLPDGPERTALLTKALAGNLSRADAVRAVKSTGKEQPAAATPIRRVVCRLAGGRTLSLSGTGTSLDSLIDTLEHVLKEARKARSDGWDVSTLAKVFRDRAGKGGAA